MCKGIHSVTQMYTCIFVVTWLLDINGIYIVVYIFYGIKLFPYIFMMLSLPNIFNMGVIILTSKLSLILAHFREDHAPYLMEFTYSFHHDV